MLGGAARVKRGARIVRSAPSALWLLMKAHGEETPASPRREGGAAGPGVTASAPRSQGRVDATTARNSPQRNQCQAVPLQHCRCVSEFPGTQGPLTLKHENTPKISASR